MGTMTKRLAASLTGVTHTSFSAKSMKFHSIHEQQVHQLGSSPTRGICTIAEEGGDSDEGSENHKLILQVVDGSSSSRFFSKSFTAEDVKSSGKVPETDDPFQYLITRLTNKDNADGMPIKFEVTKDGSLRVQIQQKLKSGLVQKRWGTEIQRENKKSVVDFMFELADGQRGAQKEVEAMAAQRDSFKASLDVATNALKLERKQMLKSFLVLFKEKQSQVITAEATTRQYQEDLQTKEKEVSEARSKGERAAVAKFLSAEPTDQSEVLYDNETVVKLAGGSKKKSATKRKRALAAQVSTGPKVYHSAEDAMDDIVGEKEETEMEVPPPPAKRPSRRAAAKPRKQTAEQDDVEESPPRTKQSGKAMKKPDKGSLDEDDDVGGGSVVDQDLKDDIMAQLSAMRDAD